jgi:tRNA(Arg) A34 adenosine deaminase TadA
MTSEHIPSRRELLGNLAIIGAGATLSTLPTTVLRSHDCESLSPCSEDPGVRSGRAVVHSAEEAAGRAVELAKEAAKQGTFGVGGLLVDKFGNVMAEATNAVVRNGETCDPTAHVERQLIDWYTSRPRRLREIPLRDLTIVTSLDPCAMCAGAIMRCGIQAIAVAEDNQAGIHEAFKSPSMMPELKERARHLISLFRTSARRPHGIKPNFYIANIRKLG